MRRVSGPMIASNSARETGSYTSKPLPSQVDRGALALRKLAFRAFDDVEHLQAVAAGDQVAQGANLLRALRGRARCARSAWNRSGR